MIVYVADQISCIDPCSDVYILKFLVDLEAVTV